MWKVTQNEIWNAWRANTRGYLWTHHVFNLQIQVFCIFKDDFLNLCVQYLMWREQDNLKILLAEIKTKGYKVFMEFYKIIYGLISKSEFKSQIII